ncbi:Acetyltransferase (GNAT) domain-containing protein [Fibrobacter intestinalis]|uniref:Acetyltransferase (GNAT) domain-containing protein n=1 Tax=Fibrobacter intestinalis TaxID=28122 RepID=A0A1M6XX16_9BACT|nr:GNAT family N-acetyltransferase [Fibrobacter intestinalis]SHL10409.1 Acetyltransferase (GNAT) domain-containing protein [Fibrobacter intestinalis]
MKCYAVCQKDEKAIGAIELIPNGRSDLTTSDSECELGYWIGKPFWGNGYIPEAASELIRRGFEELNLSAIWCGSYEGNTKFRRVQEKCGFSHHHTDRNSPVPLLNETRTCLISLLTKEEWTAQRKKQ